MTDSQITEYDLHLFGEGTHRRLFDKLGAHLAHENGVDGVRFAVWAPSAKRVSLLTDLNYWTPGRNDLKPIGGGVWQVFTPDLSEGASYKFAIETQGGHIYEKSDPMGFLQEVRPKTASRVADIETYSWNDQDWMKVRAQQNPLIAPVLVYECHLGSWMHEDIRNTPASGEGIQANEHKAGARYLTYCELADRLIPYVKSLGFTHIEVMPLAEHPFDGSWGYQVTGYYAATSRYGTPQEFMQFVDTCHQAGLGVIMDWVPGHFAKDGHGLAFFDGTHLYEHEDDRIGEHKTWGTLVFNYNRNEVRNFLTANALFWLEKFHLDGLRVDAVASMLDRSYCRPDGEWIANETGGTENWEAVRFLQEVNSLIFEARPGLLSIAEDSSNWPGVTDPPYDSGLGFNLKWDMGWMHDTLDYFAFDPIFRKHHQDKLTFGIWYHQKENYMLALSHDEVVHGKSNLIGKMPGDEWLRFANLRALLAWMYCYPGKKSLFMGMEFGQYSEWNIWGDLDWQLPQFPLHAGIQLLVGNLNELVRANSALFEKDYEADGFEWIDCSDADRSIYSFLRKTSRESLVVVANLTPIVQSKYRVGTPAEGRYVEILNTDAGVFGGSGQGNLGGVNSTDTPASGRPFSISLTLPPLSVLVLKLE